MLRRVTSGDAREAVVRPCLQLTCSSSSLVRAGGAHKVVAQAQTTAGGMPAACPLIILRWWKVSFLPLLLLLPFPPFFFPFPPEQRSYSRAMLGRLLGLTGIVASLTAMCNVRCRTMLHEQKKWQRSCGCGAMSCCGHLQSPSATVAGPCFQGAPAASHSPGSPNSCAAASFNTCSHSPSPAIGMLECVHARASGAQAAEKVEPGDAGERIRGRGREVGAEGSWGGREGDQ